MEGGSQRSQQGACCLSVLGPPEGTAGQNCPQSALHTEANESRFRAARGCQRMRKTSGTSCATASKLEATRWPRHALPRAWWPWHALPRAWWLQGWAGTQGPAWSGPPSEAQAEACTSPGLISSEPHDGWVTPLQHQDPGPLALPDLLPAVAPPRRAPGLGGVRQKGH